MDHVLKPERQNPKGPETCLDESYFECIILEKIAVPVHRSITPIDHLKLLRLIFQ